MTRNAKTGISILKDHPGDLQHLDDDLQKLGDLSFFKNATVDVFAVLERKIDGFQDMKKDLADTIFMTHEKKNIHHYHLTGWCQLICFYLVEGW